MAELDRIAGAPVFAPLYARYSASTEFPPLADAYRRIGLDPVSGTPDHDAGEDGARLRAQIMGAVRNVRR